MVLVKRLGRGQDSRGQVTLPPSAAPRSRRPLPFITLSWQVLPAWRAKTVATLKAITDAADKTTAAMASGMETEEV